MNYNGIPIEIITPKQHRIDTVMSMHKAKIHPIGILKKINEMIEETNKLEQEQNKPLTPKVTIEQVSDVIRWATYKGLL